MHGAAKDLILLLSSPLTLALVFLCAGAFLLWSKPGRKAGPVLVSAGVLILFLSSCPAVPDVLLGNLERTYRAGSVFPVPDKNGYDDIRYVVVLAGGHTQDKTVPVTSRFTYDGLVRLIEGIRLYRHCRNAKLIVSGGPGDDKVPDAVLMSDLALQLGVEKADIIMEPDSEDTYHEAVLLKGVLKQDRFFLVTSAYHMPRAMALFESQGMKPVAAPTGHYVKREDDEISLAPNGNNLVKSDIILYEWLGYIKAKAMGRM